MFLQSRNTVSRVVNRYILLEFQEQYSLRVTAASAAALPRIRDSLQGQEFPWPRRHSRFNQTGLKGLMVLIYLYLDL